MRTAIALIFLILTLGFYAFGAPQILSYESWKKQRVEQATMVLDQLLEIRRSKLNLTREEELRLRRARLKLLMMQELTPTDYLQQYVTRNYPNNFKVLERAAAKMKPSDMAEILRSYSNLLNQKPADLPAPRMIHPDHITPR